MSALDLADRLRLALAPLRRLPRVALEVLALVALHQLVTRPEVEAARSVSLGQGSMDALLGAGLIRPVGRRDAPGRPTLWATMPRFLAQFGLRDLPGAGLPLPAWEGRAGSRPDHGRRRHWRLQRFGCGLTEPFPDSPEWPERTCFSRYAR